MSMNHFLGNKISNNTTAVITPSHVGGTIVITAITNANTNAKEIEFAANGDLGILEMPASSVLNTMPGIACNSFATQAADMSVVYYEIA